MRYQEEFSKASSIIRDACMKYLNMDYVNPSKPAEKMLISNENFDVEAYIARNIKMAFDGDVIVYEMHNAKQFVAHRTWTLERIYRNNLLNEGIKSFGIQLSLAEAKEIVLSIIYLPYYDELYHAILGEGAFMNNQKIHTKERHVRSSNVCFGPFNNEVKEHSNTQLEMMKNLRQQVNNIYMFGSNSISFTYLACGKIDGMVLFSHDLCDINPGLLLCKEAGCVISNIKGGAYSYEDKSILIASSNAMLATLTSAALPKSDDGFEQARHTLVGYYGIPGSVHEQAALKMAANLDLKEIEFIPIDNPKELVNMVQYGRVKYAVLPIRDEEGNIFENSAVALNGTNLEMANVERIEVQYSLFKKHKDINSGDLNTIVTQPFVYGKVDKTLHLLMANAKRLESVDSTIAAQQLRANEYPDNTAVVCTKEAGLINRLCLVKENINNDDLPKIIEYKMYTNTLSST